jgi:hypothetical protein
VAVTFTYSGTALTTTLAQIRLEIGDTVSQTYSLTDEEIAYAETLSSTVLGAALLCAGWRLTRLSDYIAQSGGGSNTQTNQKFEQFKQVYENLKKRAATGGLASATAGGPVFGGLSKSRMENATNDSDFPQHKFKVGMDDITVDDDDTQS